MKYDMVEIEPGVYTLALLDQTGEPVNETHKQQWLQNMKIIKEIK